MSCFCCPVCGGALNASERTLTCPKGHSFDKAKSGYVNLLQSQQSRLKRHGDDKRMLIARREFLNGGFYKPLCDKLCDTVAREVPMNGVLIDTGCGEGYYTAAIAERLPSLRIGGIDISKDALHMAASRTKAVDFAVASVFSLPLADDSADAVISIFAPTADAEFHRVLKKGGKLIRAIPTEHHLFELKEAIYETARPNKPERTDIDGFTLCHREEIDYTLSLCSSDDIRHLFEMTPYYYKTGQADQERLLSRSSLSTRIAFAIVVYQKN